MTRKIIFFILLIHSFLFGKSQSLFESSDTLHRPRRNFVIATESVASISSLYLLNEVWYKQYSSGSFHTFNDAKEWLQMDKAGHAMTSYYVGRAGIEALKWSGVERKKAIIFGGTLGLAYLTGVECLDGYSSQWGFSWSDMIANSTGAAIAIGQELAWDEQRVQLKYSAHLTPFAPIRPNLLGSNTIERLLKDYNGQTYWASFNINSFLGDGSNFPTWLNLALGYGAEEMLTGHEDADWCLTHAVCTEYQRYRQYYLSVDIDLQRINYKRKWIKTLFGSFGFIKIPAPAIEFNNKGFSGHWLYF